MFFPNDSHHSWETDRYAVLALAAFSLLIFLPFIGHGFIHDDFSHLYSVVHEPLSAGLTKANGGPFYTPLSWLSFKLNWILFGESPFFFALTNLLLHIANVTLLYLFVRKLWRSSVAAWWAAAGFSLLFPADVWAVMWISTRAHILAALFYLAALTATLILTRTEKNKYPAAALVVILAALSLFSKESGITLIAAFAILLIYEKMQEQIKGRLGGPLVLMAGAMALIYAVYFNLRAQSGAVTVSVGGDQWYSYVPSFKVFFDNLSRYAWRTYGLLAVIALGLSAAAFINRRKLNLSLLTRREWLLSGSLFAIMVAPFILLTGRSGIYTYLPGVGASLLLGAYARSIFQSSEVSRPFTLLGRLPVLVIFILLTVFTVGQTLKWVRMAETNMTVIDQIAKLDPQPAPGRLILLKYAELDTKNGFPDGFASWSFDLALKLKYAQTDLNAAIVKQDEPGPATGDAKVDNFTYTIENGKPKIIEAK